jgi:Concanavalin A-like lectin/glucanases superfamily
MIRSTADRVFRRSESRRASETVVLVGLAFTQVSGCFQLAPDGPIGNVSGASDAASGSELDATAESASDSPSDSAPDALSGSEGTPSDAGGDAADGSACDAGSTRAALRFDGLTAYVRLPASPGGASNTAFSSELWFKTTAQTGVLFEVYSDNPVGADRSTYLKNGQVCFYVFTALASEVCTNGAPLNDGVWHSVAATLGVDGQLVYVDGVLSAMSPTVTASQFTYDTAFRLGCGYLGPMGPLTFFQGDLDEVRVWSVERSPAELAAGRRQSIDPATPGLQGYWKLDESGTTAIAPDSTAAAHDGTLIGFSFNPSPWVTPGAF